MSKRNLTTSILGDAGSAEASVVPNLESLNTGSDSYVTSVSDTSEFNVFQQLKIYDNYWETLFARHIINAANAGSTGALKQANIQGNTEGWCRADHMVLQVPITFTYTSNYVRITDAEATPTPATAASNAFDNSTIPGALVPANFLWETTNRFTNNPSVVFNEETLGETFAHSWIGCLDVFNRLRLLIGNNGQSIQKQIETEPIGMKYHMSTLRCGSILDNVNSEWGCQAVSGFPDHAIALDDAIFDESQVYTAATTAELGRVGRSERNRLAILNAIRTKHDYKDTNAKRFFQVVGCVDYVNNYDTRSLVAATPIRKVITTKKRYLSLPLQSIIPVFRGAKFLPPDFRFKFEFEVNDGVIIAKRTAEYTPALQLHPQIADAGRHPHRTLAEISVQADAGGIELHYPYHILRQPVQAAISSMWLQKPFLFNYEAIQTTEIIPTAGTTYVNFAISISTQRPTIMDCYLFPIQSDDAWKTSMTAAPFSLTNANLHVSNPQRILNTPHLNGNSPTIPYSVNDAKSGPVLWDNFEVMFSGRTAYRFRNDLQQVHSRGLENTLPYEFFINLFEEQSMRSTSTEYNASTFVERNKLDCPLLLNTGDCNRMMRLILQPGGWADRGVISSRQGATTITLNINFKKPLGASDRFIVIRTNPEQLVFDSDKNVTIIQWPAIKSNMGYLIPNITAAP